MPHLHLPSSSPLLLYVLIFLQLHPSSLCVSIFLHHLPSPFSPLFFGVRLSYRSWFLRIWVLYTSGFSNTESPSSCLSWLSSSQDSDLVGPPNSWFDYYNQAPSSPTSFVETDLNRGTTLTSEDEEIEVLFELQLDLQDLYIENLFLSSDEELLDDDELKSDFDVGGPFSCMDTSFLFDL